MNDKILESLKKARESSKQRNFHQSVDLIVNLKLFDPKKPENRLNEIVALPKGRGKDSNVAIFSESLKPGEYTLLGKSDIAKLASDKRQMKKMTSDVDFFLADPKLMVDIGKSLGKVLAPRGKMPTPLVGDHDSVINRFRKSVRIKVKDSPVIQCSVGTEETKDEDISENVQFILNFLEKKLPKGRNNIGKIMVKLTMGKPAKIEL